MLRSILIALFVLLFTGCTGMHEPQEPVITADDIQPNTTADEVVQAVQSEMDYSYFWLAENSEENILLAQNGELAGYNIINESDLDILRTTIANQQLKSPIISAQEAANIAGEILEYSFGVDEEWLLKMDLYLDTETWRVDSGPTPPYPYRVIIDSTTGELISVSYIPVHDMDYLNAMEASPVDDAYVIAEGSSAEGHMQNGYWDRENESFDETVNKLQAQLEEQLTDSPILQGAKIVKITEIGTDFINFAVELDNSRTLMVQRLLTLDRFTSFDYGGYPLRAYIIDYAVITN